jgi:hypothetical protein
VLRTANPVRYALIIAFLVCLAAASISFAAEIAPTNFYVNNITGSDSYDGRSAVPTVDGNSGPCRTIMEAVRKATVGAHISIARTGGDYLETVTIRDFKKGTPTAPLIIDGNGATVNGLVQVTADRWHLLKDDIYWMENRPGHNELSGMPNCNWLVFLKHQGWFTERQAPNIFFMDGKPAPHTNSLDTIPQGGYFYDTQSDPRRIYVRLPAGRKLEDVKLEFPQNQGVTIADDYVIIRNLRSIYSIDDGFAAKSGIGIVFENITGSYNCDQGFSMHHECVTICDGGLFERNAGCGICDVQNCTTIFRNVVVRDNMVTGALMKGLAHSFLSCKFYGNQGAQLSADDPCPVLLKDCSIDGGGGPGITGKSIRAEGCTFTNCVGMKISGAK